MKILAIIPARCGSKAIKDKNIINVCGKPLIAYSIEPALKLLAESFIDKVIISTDCERIATIAEKHGAEVPFLRPEAIAGDKAKSIEFILHAIEFFERKKIYFDAVLLLQPTSPLRTFEELVTSIEKFKQQNSDSLISCYQEEYINDLVMYRKNRSELLEPLNKNHNKGVRRQEHGSIYVRNGAIYITKVEYLKQTKQIISNNPVLFKMSKLDSLNIDNRDDLELFSTIMKGRKKYLMIIGVLEPEGFSLKAIDNLKALGKVEFFDGKNLEIFLLNKDILFIRLHYVIDEIFLFKSPNLKYICTPTTGLNHLKLDELKKRNVKVIALKGENEFLNIIRATPEHTFGLILALLRNYKEAFINFSSWKRDNFKGNELYGKDVGIIGFGRVGSIVAKYLEAFECKVHFFDINKKDEVYGAKRCVSIEDVIQKSHIVLLCASYSEDNIQFINKKYIDLLKDKFFINTARGELIDEEYLLSKIENNHFKGIALDVIANENYNNNLDKITLLSREKNFIVTPHIAGATFESMHKTEEFIVEKLKKVLNG